MPQVKAGRMRCLATGGDKRSAVTPDIPTLAESGVAGYRFYGWNGIIAPRGTARTIVTRLNSVLGDVLAAPDIRKSFFEFGEEPAHSTPEAFAKFIREDYESMGKLVRLAGVRAE